MQALLACQAKPDLQTINKLKNLAWGLYEKPQAIKRLMRVVVVPFGHHDDAVRLEALFFQGVDVGDFFLLG